MKSNTLRITTIIAIVLLSLGIILSFVVRSSFRLVGIEKIAHTDDLKDLSITLSFAWGSDGRGDRVISDLSNNADTYVNALHNADGIFVVEPTGDLIQYRGSFSQTVHIVKVLKLPGGETSEGDEVPIFRNGGFVENDGKIMYECADNVMYPGNQYLLFVNASELNAISEKDSFYLVDSLISCIKLTDRNQQRHCQDMDFNAYMDTTRFCATDEILNAFISLENKILKSFGVLGYDDNAKYYEIN